MMFQKVEYVYKIPAAQKGKENKDEGVKHCTFRNLRTTKRLLTILKIFSETAFNQPIVNKVQTKISLGDIFILTWG